MASKGKRSKRAQRNDSAVQAAEGALLAQSDPAPAAQAVQPAEEPEEHKDPAPAPVVTPSVAAAAVVQMDPEDEGGEDEEEDAPATRTVGPASTAIVPVGNGEKKWVWTRTKRRALQLTLDGLPIGKIADTLSKHRNTIRNWWNAPEFQAEVRQRMTEHATAAKLRQVHRTSIVGEALFTRVKDKLAALVGPDGKNKEMDVGEMQLILRELRDYQREEREITEGNVQRIEKHVFLNGQVEHTHKADSASARSFKEFLAEHQPNVTSIAALPASATPQEVLVEGVAELLQETDILDKIQEEDREFDREQAALEAETKRKR